MCQSSLREQEMLLHGQRVGRDLAGVDMIDSGVVDVAEVFLLPPDAQPLSLPGTG